MQRVRCPMCKQDGVLQWKETITKAKGKKYRYKKLYVYHQHPKEHPERPKWCYLTAKNMEALGITQNKKEPKNLKSRLNTQNKIKRTVPR